jgi:hypothetical protein
MPDFNYDPAEILAGDVVKVKMTFTKTGCGSIGPIYVTIGTFGCSVVPGAGGMRFCPYVTSLAAFDTFWNGLAIVNTGTTDGTIVLTATKKDGTTANTLPLPIGPGTVEGTMYVMDVSAIPWVGTQPLGVPASISVQASAGIPIDAFVMMSSGVHDSMGYLCR